VTVVADASPLIALVQVGHLIGVLGILLASKQKGLIPAVCFILDALVKTRFRITPDLYEWRLPEAGEAEMQR